MRDSGIGDERTVRIISPVGPTHAIVMPCARFVNQLTKDITSSGDYLCLQQEHLRVDDAFRLVGVGPSGILRPTRMVAAYQNCARRPDSECMTDVVAMTLPAPTWIASCAAFSRFERAGPDRFVAPIRTTNGVE